MYILVIGVGWLLEVYRISVSAFILGLPLRVYIRCYDRWIYLDCRLCLAVVSRWVHCIGRDWECIHVATQGFTASMVYSYCYECLWLYSFVCHCCTCVMLLTVYVFMFVLFFFFFFGFVFFLFFFCFYFLCIVIRQWCVRHAYVVSACKKYVCGVFFVQGVCCYEHYVCLLLLHRFQGIAWIGCLCVREFTAVFFIDECACLFIALLACISAQGRLYGIVRAYGSL